MISAPRREVAGEGPTRARKREEHELFRRLADGDASAREALVRRFLPLAHKLAHGYQGQGERDDLEQVAVVGLLKAIDRFDPGRGLAFSTYAFPTINGELKRYFRDRGWSVKVPRAAQELALKVDRASRDLTGPLGRAPTVPEIAQETGATVEAVLEALHLASARRADSLDEPQGDDDTESSSARSLGDADPGYAQVEDAADLEAIMRVLAPRERLILRLRFEEDLSQSQIAELSSLSQMHVSRLIRRSIARLQEAAGDPRDR
jgi:RNA polymerase sigma-B factor